MCKEIFIGGKVNYAYTTIPTYPSGQIGMMICTKAAGPPLHMLYDPKKQNQPSPTGRVDELGPLRYYDADVHSAAFVLPRFAREELADNLIAI
jgi:spermidine synthase